MCFPVSLIGKMAFSIVGCKRGEKADYQNVFVLASEDGIFLISKSTGFVVADK